LSEAAWTKKKAPVKGPISLATHHVVMMVVMVVHAAGTGDCRCDNCQSEKSCENVGE
jgi:hypothetical protein